MFTFKRELSKPFIAALQKAYEQKDWWHKIVEHKKLFVAFRNNYLNVYFKGSSLLKLKFSKGRLTGQTHYKYLLKPDEDPYITSENGVVCWPDNATERFIGDFEKPELLIRAASHYTDVEKEGIQKVLSTSPAIIDLEAALTDDGDSRMGANRIDFVAVNNGELVFYEAKHFSNPDLRASGKNGPAVLEQIYKYEGLLGMYKAEIETAYRNVMHYRTQLHLAYAAPPPDSLRVCLKPRLVVFGFDQDQKEGKVWGRHRKKLEDALEHRLILKGNPGGLSIG